MTNHGTILGWNSGELIQITDPNDSRAVRFDEVEIEVDKIFSGGPLHGFQIKTVGRGVGFLNDEGYLSASGDRVNVETGRTAMAGWETFSFVSDDSLSSFTKSTSDPEAEMNRFRLKVLSLIEAGQPVKIYPGCGYAPRDGFLNLDIVCMQPNYMLEKPDNYFIFPFVCKWDIPDNCVDYIFTEDFMEHVSQLMQWQFLTETRRVLKSGSWQRVNTPDIIWSMKNRSDFSRGFDGVYTGELEYEHIAILSHLQLKEIAQTIGYKEIIFTTHSHGVSEYSEADIRPGPDRDKIGGNIYADLKK
jgi:hypothetical protein